MPHAYAHRHAHHFYYEKVEKPFLGPRRRATAALKKVTIQPLSEESFLDFLKENYATIYSCLEWVRFHKFEGEASGERMIFRLAITNLVPDPTIRDLLFHLREQVTVRTGWYPVVQGSRAAFAQLPSRPANTWSMTLAHLGSTGELGCIDSMVPLCSSSESGNSFALQGSRGRLLLDFGTNWPRYDAGPFTLRFLTHYHRDHSGGIWDAIRESDSPVVLSRPSLAYLCSLDAGSVDDKRRLVSNSLLPEEVRTIELSDGCQIEFFPVFHCPGSFGISITDCYSNSIVYFGDVCLGNGFYNYADTARQIVMASHGTRKWVLLDGATVGRTEDTIEEDDNPRAVLDQFGDSSRHRNVIFMNTQPEALLYSYILVFLQTRPLEPPVRILLSSDLYNLLRTLWRPVILRDQKNIDPFVRSAIGKSMANFVETHRLYPLTQAVLSKIPSDEGCIVFASPRDITEVTDLQARIKRADVVLSGTMALRSDVPPEILQARPRSIVRVASPDWSFHSDEQTLADFIRTMTACGVGVLLFHNFPKRFERLIRRYGFDPNLVKIITDKPIILGRLPA